MELLRNMFSRSRERGSRESASVIKESAAPEQIEPVDFSMANTFAELFKIIREKNIGGTKRSAIQTTENIIRTIQLFRRGNKEFLIDHGCILDDETTYNKLKIAVEGLCKKSLFEHNDPVIVVDTVHPSNPISGCIFKEFKVGSKIQGIDKLQGSSLREYSLLLDEEKLGIRVLFATDREKRGEYRYSMRLDPDPAKF